MKGKFQEALMDESSLMFGLLQPEPVRKLVKEHQSGRQDNHKVLFSLVMFEQWLRTSHVDQAPRRRHDDFAWSTSKVISE
jgi:hypothetical protein